MSETVRTQAGFHLLQVAEKQEEMQQPLEDVKESIRLILADGQTRDRYKEWLKELRDEAQVRIVY